MPLLHCDEIRPRIFLGNCEAPDELKTTHVLSIRESGVSAVRYPDRVCRHITLDDDEMQDIGPYLDSARMWIRKERLSVAGQRIDGSHSLSRGNQPIRDDCSLFDDAGSVCERSFCSRAYQPNQKCRSE